METANKETLTSLVQKTTTKPNQVLYSNAYYSAFVREQSIFQQTVIPFFHCQTTNNVRTKNTFCVSEFLQRTSYCEQNGYEPFKE